MFSRHKMVEYPVTWSSDIKYNIINEFPHPENLVDDIQVNVSIKVNVNYSIFMFSSHEMAAYPAK